MKFLVGYDGTESAHRALALACDQAKLADALIYVVTSMGGGEKENWEEIKKTEKNLEKAKDFLLKAKIQCETIQLAAGYHPARILSNLPKTTASTSSSWESRRNHEHANFCLDPRHNSLF